MMVSWLLPGSRQITFAPVIFSSGCSLNSAGLQPACTNNCLSLDSRSCCPEGGRSFLCKSVDSDTGEKRNLCACATGNRARMNRRRRMGQREFHYIAVIATDLRDLDNKPYD